MKGTIYVSGMGTVFIPARYYADIYECMPVRLFELCDSNKQKSIKFLRNGGTVVITGKWSDVSGLLQYVVEREDDILPITKDKNVRVMMLKLLKHRILTPINETPLFVKAAEQSIVAGFLGETNLPESIPIVAPVYEAIRIMDGISKMTYVESMDIDISTHPDVLCPKSTETISLISGAIEYCRNEMPLHPKVLDMGCGSGILTAAAIYMLKDKLPFVAATDILPEAAATTLYNIRTLSEKNMIDPKSIAIFTGDLFEALYGDKFDMIIFNAPWVPLFRFGNKWCAK